MADGKIHGLITITFDDGLLCQFQNGYPILREFGVKGVVYVPTGLVGQWFEGQKLMNLSQLQELAKAGWDIGSHTVSHPMLVSGRRTKLPLAALEAELRESREWLIANGFPVISFAYPYGQCNDEISAITRRYYRYARTAGKGLNGDGLNEPSSGNATLNAFNLCHQIIHQWKLAVDEAMASKRWLIAIIHNVVESADKIPTGKEARYIASDELAECLQYGLSTGLPFRTFREVYEESQQLPETPQRTYVAPQKLRAGVRIQVRIVGSMAKVRVDDYRKGFKLKFQHHATERAEILCEISKRIAFDFDLSSQEIERLAEFGTYDE